MAFVSAKKPILLNRLCFALLLAVPFFAACSSQQLYGSGQEWQRTECYKINDLLVGKVVFRSGHGDDRTSQQAVAQGEVLILFRVRRPRPPFVSDLVLGPPGQSDLTAASGCVRSVRSGRRTAARTERRPSARNALDPISHDERTRLQSWF